MDQDIQNNAAPEAANAKTKEKEPFSLTGVMFDAVSVVITSIFIITVVFTFCFRLVGVSGESMLQTLKDKDWLLVTPYYSQPEYGDIVISTKEVQSVDGSLVKRVIAVAGDEIFMDAEGGVYVNGEKLDCSYAYEDPFADVRIGRFGTPTVVPEGCVVLMGDNRRHSYDSRYVEIGFPEEEYLLGKARLRLSENWNIYANFPG